MIAEISDQDVSTIMAMVNQQYELPNLIAGSRNNFQELTAYYYRQARNLYIANVVLNNHLKQTVEEKNAVASRIVQAELNSKNRSAFKKKRVRRLGSQIERAYKCKVGDCTKAYGSEGSLMQHIKLKHLAAYQNQLQQEQYNS